MLTDGSGDRDKTSPLVPNELSHSVSRSEGYGGWRGVCYCMLRKGELLVGCWDVEADEERQEADRNERAQLDEKARESKLERIYRLDQRETNEEIEG